MQTIESRNEKLKAKLPEGLWQEEPDKIQWEDKETKLPCLIVRNNSGNLCGYVGVSEKHPLYQKAYQESEDLNCHGGLTFSGFCQEREDGICHKPDPGEPEKVWWLGFDCAHGGDIIPSFMTKEFMDLGIKTFTDRDPFEKNTYKDIAYVQKECAGLAKQLAAVE